jgi:putative transposase
MWSNAICERLIGTLRRELLDRTLILNQARRRAVLSEYQEHYNSARPIRASASVSPALIPVPGSPQPTLAPGRSAENRS